MNTWHTFLQQQSASISSKNHISFSESPSDYPLLEQQSTLTPLIHLGLIVLDGPDAKSFLQGQVTCDVQQLSPQQSIPGARCNPKGRALTSFLLHELNEQQLLMIMDHSLVELTIQELSKYAAFFKVELNDASEQYSLMGLSGELSASHEQTIAAISNYQLGDGRRLLIASSDQAQNLWLQLSQDLTPVGTEFWVLQDIRAGLGTLQTETSGMFIPQMLNLQAIDGISFKKGCYTGQEVVARMKYLGKLKRRMYRVTMNSSELPAPGTACHLPEQKQSIGNVVIAAKANEYSQELLLVLTEAAAQSETLIIGQNNHQTIIQQPLPYEI
jgi:tRNA-modifying protein YgfZ